MDKKAIMDKLSGAYEAIQRLECQPTKHNVVIIAEVLVNLEDVFKAISEEKQPEAPAEEESSDG